MNILILYITLCTALSSVNALTPQILMSINEGVNRRQNVPVNPDENLITAVCKTNPEMVETNATTTALSDIYRKCKVSGTRYCRLRLLQPERRYLISREIDWTKNYSVIATKYQSIPVHCHENDVSNYAMIIFQDHFETNSTKHVSLYSISQCEEDEEHGYGFYVTMCIFGFLTILVVIGTLLELCTVFHQNKTQYIKGKRKKQTSVPGWRFSRCTIPCEYKNKINIIVICGKICDSETISTNVKDVYDLNNTPRCQKQSISAKGNCTRYWRPFRFSTPHVSHVTGLTK
ncbi:uncharacterized protein LOC120327311 isoform X2 [Styela clava]